MQKKDFVSHFKQDLFLPQMKAESKEQAIEELLDLFVNEKYIRNPHIVLEMLHQRETLGSTGIGEGIAIPHGRTVAASDVLIAFGKSEKGIDFDSVDQIPVHLFFMVLAPPHDEENIYLPILGSLVTILKDKKNRDELLNVETFEDFISILDGGQE